VALGQISSSQYHSINTTCLSLSTCCSYQKDRGAKPENLLKSNALSEIGKHWIEKLHSLSPLKVLLMGNHSKNYQQNLIFVHIGARLVCFT
jgi:hypothetical protein